MTTWLEPAPALKEPNHTRTQQAFIWCSDHLACIHHSLCTAACRSTLLPSCGRAGWHRTESIQGGPARAPVGFGLHHSVHLLQGCVHLTCCKGLEHEHLQWHGQEKLAKIRDWIPRVGPNPRPCFYPAPCPGSAPLSRPRPSQANLHPPPCAQGLTRPERAAGGAELSVPAGNPR